MARRLLRPVPGLRGRAREGARRRDQPPRRRDRRRGAQGRSAPRRDARAHCRRSPASRSTASASRRPPTRSSAHSAATKASPRWRPPRSACLGARRDRRRRSARSRVRVLDACRARKWTIATAESCTGGLVAGALTEIAGSSDGGRPRLRHLFQRSQEAMLGVPEATLIEHGAVSRPIAEAMAQGRARRAGVDLTVAITGIAGPGGGSAEKPVGLVHSRPPRATVASFIARSDTATSDAPRSVAHP